MKLLILGGTQFVGRHIVEAALAAGHEVSLFHRGQTNPDLFPEAEHLYGDREADLSPLADRRWDAMIDTSGYTPGPVRRSAEALKGRVGQYVFISTVSVYDDPPSGADESAPLQRIDPAEASTSDSYGGLKVLCEEVVQDIYPRDHLIIRPGIVAGPHDPTDRFTYWVRRIHQSGEVLAPERRDQPVQVIDARDLAAWLVRLIERGETGVFNATGPAEPLTLEEMLTAIKRGLRIEATLTWVDAEFLTRHGVSMGELPFWTLGQVWGAFQIDSSQAQAHGLTYRPLAETARDTLAWVLERPPTHKWRAGLRDDQHAELLSLWHARG